MTLHHGRDAEDAMLLWLRRLRRNSSRIFTHTTFPMHRNSNELLVYYPPPQPVFLSHYLWQSLVEDVLCTYRVGRIQRAHAIARRLSFTRKVTSLLDCLPALLCQPFYCPINTATSKQIHARKGPPLSSSSIFKRSSPIQARERREDWTQPCLYGRVSTEALSYKETP
jgi:hypothetical protein